jgi:hypothetical protein
MCHPERRARFGRGVEEPAFRVNYVAENAIPNAAATLFAANEAADEITYFDVVTPPSFASVTN